MQLSELLRADLIQTDLAAKDKFAAIAELIELLIDRGALDAKLRAAALKALRAREELMSTGMEHGIAIPHAPCEGVGEVVAALGLSRRGLDFDALDGKPTHIIILLVSPPNTFQTHVKTLAGIARVLNDERLRSELRGAGTADQAYQTLVKHENR